MTSTDAVKRAAALTGILGLAAASWVVAVHQLSGMDMGAATELGSLPYFIAVALGIVIVIAPASIPGLIQTT